MLISDDYRALNYEMHQRGGYGVSGFHYAQIVRDMMAKWKCETALDYGCGQRTLRKALEPLGAFELREYDPALPEYAGMPDKADLVICTDVLEHIEPECLDAVLDHIHGLSRTVTLLGVSMQAAAKTLPDGRNAHLIVEGPDFWFPRIEKRWKSHGVHGTSHEFWFAGVPI